MRYNPATDRARSIDSIAAECRAAISRPVEPPNWGLLLRLAGEREGLPTQRSYLTMLEISHAMAVAKAFGDHAEWRRLQSCLLTGLY